MNNFILAPSLLSADFSNLANAIKMIEDKNAKFVHIDVMDGSFVPQISYGQPVVKSIRPLTDCIFDVHLMINAPQNHIKSFAESGADYITIHYESVKDVDDVINQIHSLKKKAGLAIKPKTNVLEIEKFLKNLDLILVMTVEPGFGGQKMIPECVSKISELVKMRKEKNLNFKISVDGGINENTISDVVNAGADIVVSGSAFFSGRL